MIGGERVHTERRVGNPFGSNHSIPRVKPIRSEAECILVQRLCAGEPVRKDEAIELLGSCFKLDAFLVKYSTKLAIWESRYVIGAHLPLDQELIDQINAFRSNNYDDSSK